MNLTKRFPMLRWSNVRLAIGMHNIPTTGQIGDRREAAAEKYVLGHARPGDVDDMIAALDTFAYTKSLLVSVGDEKGALLDDAVRRADPRLALELGTYCGYGALRIARAAPSARIYSVELCAANAEIAQRIWAHGGVDDRVTCVVGTIGDDGHTLDVLAGKHGFSKGALDFLFLDHDKAAYLADLHSIRGCGWLRPGSIVVADNIKLPGAPAYRKYMQQNEGRGWSTIEHKAHGEYQTLFRDLVLESELLHPVSSNRRRGARRALEFSTKPLRGSSRRAFVPALRRAPWS